jgi:hypothetical protein
MNRGREKSKSYTPYVFTNIGGTLMIVFTYLVYKYPNSIGGFGGSFILFLFMLGFIGSVYFIKPISLELSFILLIIAGIMGINFLGYLEMTYGLNITYSWIFIGCVFWTLYWFVYSLFILLKTSTSLNEFNKSFKVKLTITLAPPFLISMIFLAITRFIFLDNTSRILAKNIFYNSFLKYTIISTGGFILGLFISLIYLLKLDNKNIKNIIIDDKCNVIRYDRNKFKKHFILVFCLFILLGSIFEIFRGMWIMWFETILLFGLMSLIIWKIYKHVFIEE